MFDEDREDSLIKMTAAASMLGWKPGEFPDTFKSEGRTWEKREVTAAQSGEILCVQYEDTSAVKSEDAPNGYWMVVWND